jgi:hypothetical protein
MTYRHTAWIYMLGGIWSIGMPAPTPPCSLTSLPEVQDLPFNEVTFLGTHNPASFKAGIIDVTNQSKNVEQQLLDGVRVFSLRAHDALRGTARHAAVCHGNMAIRLPGTWGQGTACDVDPSGMSLTNFLTIIKKFLDQYQDEIITLHIADFTNENNPHGSPDLIAQAFDQANILPLVYHASARPGPWPTIRTLIKNNTRLIVIHSDNNQDSAYNTWLLPKWSYVIDTPSGQSSAKALMSDYINYQPPAPEWQSPAYTNRLNPQLHNALLKVNHHITKGLAGSKKIAATVNTYDKVITRLRAWTNIFGIPAHALIVDFYDTPDAQDLCKAVIDITKEHAARIRASSSAQQAPLKD